MWFQFISSWCNDFWLNTWCNGFIQRANFMIKYLVLYSKFCFVLNHTNSIVCSNIWIDLSWFSMVICLACHLHCFHTHQKWFELPRRRRLYISKWLFCMVSFHSTTLARIGINTCLASWATSACFEKTVGTGLVPSLSILLTVYPVHCVLFPMAPVVHIEPNGVQMLLLFDNTHEDLESNGWLVFIKRIEGFNLVVS